MLRETVITFNLTQNELHEALVQATGSKVPPGDYTIESVVKGGFSPECKITYTLKTPEEVNDPK